MIGALILAALLAQSAAPAKADPVLSETQRLQVQNLALRIENAQLRAQQIEREFTAAREELAKLVAALKVEGYTLDLQSMTYVKESPPAK